MNNIKTKTLTKDDWALYKSLRLSSLKDSPDSFGSTFEQEKLLSDEEWSSRLDYAERDMKGLLIVALFNDNPVGLACGIVHEPGDQDGYIYQMWVSPDARSLGVGKLLLAHIINWANSLGLKNLSLGVTTTNLAAAKLYKTFGFVPDGALDSLRDDSKLKVQPMKLEFDTSR